MGRGLAIVFAAALGFLLVIGLSLPYHRDPIEGARSVRADHQIELLDVEHAAPSPPRGGTGSVWDSAEAEGYHWAQEKAVNDVKACDEGASPAAFRKGCAEWVAEAGGAGFPARR